MPLRSGLEFPEEILEQIISFAFSCGQKETTYEAPRTVLSCMLVCRSFYRIAKPLLYSRLHLRTRRKSEKLAEVFKAQPSLTAYIRTVRVEGPFASHAFLVASQILSGSNDPMSHALDVLDIGLVYEHSDRKELITQRKEDLARLKSALNACPDTKCLIVRQDPYVSCGAIISFTHALASSVSRWKDLESVDLQMKPTPLPNASGSPRPDPLAAALANSKKLKVLRARQPTLLNSFLLDVARNSSLQRIELINAASSFPDQLPLFLSYLGAPFPFSESCCNHITNSTLVQPPRQPQNDEAVCTCLHGDVRQDCRLFEAAQEELEAQLATEPQTLFASQIISHPRLCALIRVGRLHLIMERLQMSKWHISLNGSNCECSYHASVACPLRSHRYEEDPVQFGMSSLSGNLA